VGEPVPVGVPGVVGEPVGLAPGDPVNVAVGRSVVGLVVGSSVDGPSGPASGFRVRLAGPTVDVVVAELPGVPVGAGDCVGDAGAVGEVGVVVGEVGVVGDAVGPGVAVGVPVGEPGAPPPAPVSAAWPPIA
jgi:hypothetical protein